MWVAGLTPPASFRYSKLFISDLVSLFFESPNNCKVWTGVGAGLRGVQRLEFKMKSLHGGLSPVNVPLSSACHRDAGAALQELTEPEWPLPIFFENKGLHCEKLILSL